MENLTPAMLIDRGICPTCYDKENNHYFHIQLIPRYDYEKRGSKNFVKERKEYTEDIKKNMQIRKLLNKKIN